MPFLNSAKQYVQALKHGSAERLILEYLLKHGIGHRNAKPWSAIDDHLKKNGIAIRQQTFQQGLLKKSRTGDLFIGANDHEPGKGYFLIQEKEDAELMRRWYIRRIEVEQKHLQHLEALIAQEWP